MSLLNYQRGEFEAEGKTKKTYGVMNHPDLVWLEYKKDVTAYDDATRTKQFPSKDVDSTTITCGLFEFLKRRGVPVAYVEQISDIGYVAQRCTMYPIEVVFRDYAFGGYTDRFPEFKRPSDGPPYILEHPVVEFFLKTKDGKILGPRGEILLDGLNPARGEEDPWIINPFDDTWILFHSHKNYHTQEGDLHRQIARSQVVRGGTKQIKEVEALVTNASLYFQSIWLQKYQCHLIDIKYELGLNSDGKLCIADGISPDEFRLRDVHWNMLDKELHRLGEDVEKVANAYAIVASMVSQLRRQWL